MKLQVINDIHTILQENVNVTHRKCQDYKNALKAKKLWVVKSLRTNLRFLMN